jgi:hypothetical protein
MASTGFCMIVIELTPCHLEPTEFNPELDVEIAKALSGVVPEDIEGNGGAVKVDVWASVAVSLSSTSRLLGTDALYESPSDTGAELCGYA